MNGRGDVARAENAEYMRRYRDQRADYVELTKAQARARNRARVQLSKRHEAEFRKLYEEELAVEGVESLPRPRQAVAQ